MIYQHKDLATGRWQEFSLVEQMAHVGSEVIRAIKWRQKGKLDYCRLAFYRALELLRLTKDDPKNRFRLQEVCRVYECLVDDFAGNNIYHSTDQGWERYFMAFNWFVITKKPSL